MLKGAPRSEVNSRTGSDPSLDEVKVRSLDTFSSPIFILLNGKISFANAASCDAFGAQSVDQIVGSMITERLADVQPDGLPLRASMDKFNAEYKLNGFVRRMWAFKRMDGSSLTIRSTISSIPHPTVRCSVVVVDDLKAFAAELALRNQAVGASDRMSNTAQVLTSGARELSEASDRASSALRSALDSAEATAKAERAGDAGRTFAVVAAEVRRLAVDTAKASGDIKAQVQQVQTVTKSAVTAIDGISGSVDLLKEDTIELASDLRQQKNAIDEAG